MPSDRERWERKVADDGPDPRWGWYEMERGRRQAEARWSLLIADIMGGSPDEIAERFVARFVEASDAG